MKCLGAAVPTGSTTMNFKWTDNNDIVQQATAISAPAPTTFLEATTKTFASNPLVYSKRFKNQGMKAFYTFSMRASENLDENSRIYFNFNFNLNSKLDR